MAYQGEDLTNYQAGWEYLPQKKYSLNYTLPTEEEETVTQGSGIPYTNAFTQSGGSSNYTGSTQNLIGDFGTAITDRQAKINEMNRPMRPERRTANYNQPGQGVFTPAEQPTFKRSIQDFIYDKVPYIDRPQSYEDIMTKGYQKPTGPGLPTIFNFMNKMGIQNFASLPQSDQAFIKSQTGYRGPTVFGENTGGHNVDPFGKNIESLFGNYAEGVQKDYDKLSDYFGSEKFSKKYGDATLTLNEETGQYEFTGVDPRVVGTKLDPNYMNKMNLARYNFRKKQVDQQSNIKSDLGLIEQGQGEALRQVKRQSEINRERDEGGWQSDMAKDEAFMKGPAKGEQLSDVMGSFARGGRVGFKYGGLAGIL